jgi:fermentation-respiration switch protein FrsA (DUF1100 family)
MWPFTSSGNRDPVSAAVRRPAPLWLRATRVSLMSYVGICVVAMSWENQLIFNPARYPEGNWTLPRDVENASFVSLDGTKIHGWLWTHPDPRAVILFAHGNAQNLTDWANTMSVYRDRLKSTILIFDYRGYGCSEGSPSEAGILMDARAARNWLSRKTGATANEIVLMGQSLGGAVMVDVAAKDGARGLIVDRSFDSLPSVAAYHYPFLPVGWLMRTRLNAAAVIREYRGPLLVVHGEHDDIVPARCGRALFDAANEPKKLLMDPRLGHNDFPNEEVLAALEAFVADLPPLPSPDN